MLVQGKGEPPTLLIGRTWPINEVAISPFVIIVGTVYAEIAVKL